MFTLEAVARFATTPSGWLTGIAIPLCAVWLGYKLPAIQRKKIETENAHRAELDSLRQHVDDKFDQQNRALESAARALAVLVENDARTKSDIERLRDDLTITQSNVNGLDRAVAVLDETVKNHERWSHERYQESLQRRNPE